MSATCNGVVGKNAEAFHQRDLGVTERATSGFQIEGGLRVRFLGLEEIGLRAESVLDLGLSRLPHDAGGLQGVLCHGDLLADDVVGIKEARHLEDNLLVRRIETHVGHQQRFLGRRDGRLARPEVVEQPLHADYGVRTVGVQCERGTANGGDHRSGFCSRRG